MMQSHGGGGTTDVRDKSKDSPIKMMQGHPRSEWYLVRSCLNFRTYGVLSGTIEYKHPTTYKIKED